MKVIEKDACNNSNFDADFIFVIFLNTSQVNSIDISRKNERFLISTNIVHLYEVSWLRVFLQDLERALIWYINEGV